MIKWERANEKYELPLEELKANCAWMPIEERISPTRRTYRFDHRDIQRHVERRYGNLDTFFATLEKKRFDKKLELERMEKQRRWAREEIERRMAAGEAEEQVTADVLRKYGLESPVEPAPAKKSLR
jgi:tRNA G10  N-methylase Trm11